MSSNSLIIKLVDKRHLHQFLKVGELHFGTTVQYQEIENSGKNSGIGDRLEGDYDPFINTKGIFKNTVNFPKASFLSTSKYILHNSIKAGYRN